MQITPTSSEALTGLFELLSASRTVAQETLGKAMNMISTTSHSSTLTREKTLAIQLHRFKAFERSNQ